MTLEIPDCEIEGCGEKAERIVPMETGTSFLSLALCIHHFAAHGKLRPYCDLRSRLDQAEEARQ